MSFWNFIPPQYADFTTESVSRLANRIMKEQWRLLLRCWRLKRACQVASDRSYERGKREGHRWGYLKGLREGFRNGQKR